MDGQQGLVGGDAKGIGGNFKDKGQHPQAGAAQEQPFDHQSRQLPTGFTVFNRIDIALKHRFLQKSILRLYQQPDVNFGGAILVTRIGHKVFQTSIVSKAMGVLWFDQGGRSGSRV